MLQISLRYRVYSLLSFCTGSCQCGNNFIGFSGNTLLFNLSFITIFICYYEFKLNFFVLSIIVSLTVVHRTAYEVWVQTKCEIPPGVVLLRQSQYDLWCNMIGYDMMRYEMTRHDTMLYDTTWYMIWDDVMQCDAMRYDPMRCDAIWYHTWYDMIIHGSIKLFGVYIVL